MRLPDDRRLIACDSALCAPDMFVWVDSDRMLVLMLSILLPRLERRLGDRLCFWFRLRDHLMSDVARLTWLSSLAEENFRAFCESRIGRTRAVHGGHGRCGVFWVSLMSHIPHAEVSCRSAR